MTIVRHELKQGFKAFLIWTLAIAFMTVICVFMYPEMKGEMDSVSDMFASMGSFTAAFGMDKLNFGTLLGFYAVECGNMLGLGGSFFAALIAVAALSKEEKDGTAEFLLTHPVSRVKVISEKLTAVVIELLALNVTVWLLSLLSIIAIGESIAWRELTLMHVAYLLMQLEIAGICFAISAFVRRGSIGIGLGLATMMYFLNIIANITESAKFLKYITPFGYTEGADIVSSSCLDTDKILIGMAVAVVGVAVAYTKYTKKDIR